MNATLSLVLGFALAASLKCAAEIPGFRFIECPMETAKTKRSFPAAMEAKKPDRPGDPIPLVLTPGANREEDALEVKCPIIRIADTALRGEVIYTAKFTQSATLSNTSVVVLLDGVAVADDRVALLIVDNTKPFSPVVLLDLKKQDGVWLEGFRKEISAVYPNYMAKNAGDELRYDLVPKGEDAFEVVAKRASDGNQELQVNVSLSPQ